uniref:PAN domain protein n=1 Tax=Loa loa TaxID=7209 RepID=A0A1I7VM68_LOALO
MAMLLLPCAHIGKKMPSTGKRRKTEFEISTGIISKEAEEAKQTDQGYSSQDKGLSTTDSVVSVSQQRNLVIGAPDLSDVCFRVYNEFIVVNAQPYERRSNMQLEKCKQRCMQSQSGIYSCRSLVYDVANKICDFFAHQGDQPPARMLKYYEHSYLEPTFAHGCDLEYAKKSKKTTFDSTDRKLSNTLLLNVLTKEDTNQETCEEGKAVKYLHTQGFKFDSANRIDLKAYDLNACMDACTNNIDDKGRIFGCRSFDYNEDGCSLFGETVLPRDTRQLKQNSYANYYEKICVEDDLMSSECQSINRFPQMILVGFAETVVTARSFVGCFENCLKSRQLFAMNCTSAVYFYKELEQNCILNSENRQTQKNLFMEENTDIVDYFEISCPLRKQKKKIDDSLFRS